MKLFAILITAVLLSVSYADDKYACRYISRTTKFETEKEYEGTFPMRYKCYHNSQPSRDIVIFIFSDLSQIRIFDYEQGLSDLGAKRTEISIDKSGETEILRRVKKYDELGVLVYNNIERHKMSINDYYDGIKSHMSFIR